MSEKDRPEESPEGTPAESPSPEAEASPAADAGPVEGEAPAVGDVPAEGEPHAEGEAPAEAEAHAEGEAPAEGEAHAEGESHAEGTTPAEGDASRPRKPRPRDPAVLRAWRAGLPVEGKIDKVIKGGYEVRVGRLRGFCPHSQMDVHRVENPEEHVGKVYAFRILQLRRGGEDVVISRRALLEEERGDEQKAVRATLVEGALTAGHVARTTEFGVFVDLGAGVTGLVHLTEISHARIGRPADVVKPGDFVQVKILRIDDASGKISLSMKQAQDDPWAGVADQFRPGEAVRATVRRHVDFGAFVEVRPGLEALVPSRELPPSAKPWRDDLTVGSEHEFRVLAVDPARRRLTLVPAGSAEAAVPEERIVAGEHVTGRVQKVESFGVFVWLAPGKVGLMPKVWTGVPYGQPFEPRFPVGSEIACEVVEVVDGGKRIRLAAEGIARREAEERRDRPPRGGRDRDRDRGPHGGDAPEPQEPQGTFGTNLGDALKAALQRSSE